MHRKRWIKQPAIEAKSSWTKAATTAAAIVALGIVGGVASAQNAPPAGKTVQVGLISQDFSDCTNANVKDDPNRIRGGLIKVSRQGDATQVAVAMTANPNTTYHFFLKCVRLLGEITTDSEGTGTGVFAFSNASAGPVFAFDSYPEGAPAGNKFQSVTVDMR